VTPAARYCAGVLRMLPPMKLMTSSSFAIDTVSVSSSDFAVYVNNGLTASSGSSFVIRSSSLSAANSAFYTSSVQLTSGSSFVVSSTTASGSSSNTAFNLGTASASSNSLFSFCNCTIVVVLFPIYASTLQLSSYSSFSVANTTMRSTFSYGICLPATISDNSFFSFNAVTILGSTTPLLYSSKITLSSNSSVALVGSHAAGSLLFDSTTSLTLDATSFLVAKCNSVNGGSLLTSVAEYVAAGVPVTASEILPC